MLRFSGYLREEEDYPMPIMNSTRYPAGIGSTSALAGTLADSNGDNNTTEESNRLPQRSHPSRIRRIDMASRINEGMPYENEFQKAGTEDLETTQIVEIQDWSDYGDDTKTENSEDSEAMVAVCGIILCRPFVCRMWSAGMFLLAFLLMGLGVGLTVRENASKSRAFAAAQGEGTDAGQAVGGVTSTGTVQPSDDTSTTSPQESLSPSSYPTPFFEIDVDEYLDENTDLALELSTDNGNQNVEWDNSASPYLVGAYYYPWYGGNFHNGDGYVRKDLIPQQQPTLGEYDDSKAETVAQHLQWSRQANIGLWITSWWGPDRLEDSNTKDVIMTHENLGDLKISLHYETSNRVQEGLEVISNDMQYMCDNYFDHPNYYKVDGRPVLFVYVSRKLEIEGILESTILTMRTASSKCGHNLYLIGDHVFDSAPDEAGIYVPFWYFDAVTNYDVYGSMGKPSPYAGLTVVDQYYSDQEQWRARAHEGGCGYIPAVSPGYNDRGVRFASNHPPLSRKLSETSIEGSLFAYQLSKAKSLVDPSVDNLLVVNSFNEWHEDTQIEPATGETTNAPFNLTQGIYYEGYGELYLNLLRQWTIS